MDARRFTESEGRPARRLMGVVLLAIILARTALVTVVYARPNLAIANDSDRYIPIANGILDGTAYAWNTERPGELLNTIGYPLAIAGAFALFGHGIGNIALLQLLLSGGFAFAFYALLAGRIGAKAAFAGATLLAIDPLTALWSMTILAEGVFATVLGIGAILIAIWARNRAWTTLMLAGTCLALATLVKPYGLLVAGVSLVWVVAVPRTGRELSLGTGISKGRRVVALLAPLVLLVAPWYVRNALLWDCASLSSVDRVTVRDYVAAKVLAEAEGRPLSEVQAQLQKADPGVCPRQLGKYLDAVLTQPQGFVRLHIAGTVPVLIGTNFDRWLSYFGREYALPDLWRPYMDGGLAALVSVLGLEFSRNPELILAAVGLTAYQLIFYLLAIAGSVVVLKRSAGPDRWLAVALIATIFVLILTPGQGGNERFRVPVQPFLALLVSLGIAARDLNPAGVARSSLT